MASLNGSTRKAEGSSFERVLIDTFGRVHNKLRISVTDRCNLRCTYCMPEEVEFLDRSELFTFEEITNVVQVAASLGIDSLRLTGGEPLLRRDLHLLIRQLIAIPGIHDISLTTNALLLKQQAANLLEAGVRHLNVSLDTLDRSRFLELTRRDALPQVLEGLEEAKRVGFERIKVNAISIRGSTEEDILPLAHYCRENGFELRFIEYMPIGAGAWERDRVLFAHEILERLESEFGPIVPAPNYDPKAPAMDFVYADGGGHLGLIASVSRPFCQNCNRLRLTAEGKLRNCLFSLDEVDLKPAVRSEIDEEKIAFLIQECVRRKMEGHEINTARFIKPLRTMHTIGG
jgi:cyclic pyranopterin phosphate synthase